MPRKIATVKDWKLMQEGKQFIPIKPYSVKRLKDGTIFEGGIPYAFGQIFDDILIITEFHLDLIHVTYRVFSCKGKNSYSQKMSINNLSKSTNTIDGVYGISVKVPRRRRVAAKK